MTGIKWEDGKLESRSSCLHMVLDVVKKQYTENVKLVCTHFWFVHFKVYFYLQSERVYNMMQLQTYLVSLFSWKSI